MHPKEYGNHEFEKICPFCVMTIELNV